MIRMQSFTPRDWGLLILRLGLGITLLAHGYPKFFDGGPAAFARYLTRIHFPAPQLSAWFMAVVEFVGGLALIAGFQTTYFGYLAALERLLIGWRLKMALGVKFIAVRGVGWEFDYVLLCMAVAVALLGAGAITVEAFVRSRRGM